LSGPRSLGEVVDMVMYKQGSGLVAGGTIGPQSTGPMMAPKKLQYNLQSTSSEPIPGYTYEMNPVEYQLSRFTNWLSGGQNAKLQEDAWKKTQPAPPMPQAPQAPQSAPPMPLRPSQAQASLQAQPAAASGQVVTPSFRLPLQSRMESVKNPYGEEYQRALEGRAVEQAEQQAAIQARQLSSQLATSGLMSGGSAGLSAALGQQLALQTGGERSRALRDIALQVPGKRAEFEATRAREVDAYNRNLQSVAMDLEMQPSRVGTAQAQLQAQNIQNALGGLDLDTKQKLQETVLNDAAIQNEMNKLNLNAAQVLQFMNDPTQWWNHPAWPLLSRIAGLALQVPGGAYSAVGGVMSNIAGGMMSPPAAQPGGYTPLVRPYNQRQGIS